VNDALLGAVALLGIAGALGGIWVLSLGKRRRGALPPAPRVPIAEARGSAVVRIVGIVSASETLFAPLSGRECVFYVATAHARDADGPVLVREQRGLPFELHDGTGRALVDPEGATGAWDARPLRDYPLENVQSFVRRHQAALAARPPGTDVVYHEWLIGPDAWLAAQGQPERAPATGTAAQTAYRAQVPSVVRMAVRAEQPLYLSDRRDAAGRGPPAHLAR
jgi:hypothetical protein